MHKIGCDLPIETCAGWINHINAMNAMAGYPHVSKYTEILLIRVMRGDLAADDTVEKVLSFHAVTRRDETEQVLRQEGNPADSGRGITVSRLCGGDPVLKQAEADLFAVRSVEASLFHYNHINFDFLGRLHHCLFQDMYFSAGILRGDICHKDADFVLPADLPEALKAWCNKLARTEFCEDIFGKQLAEVWAGFDRIHPFCEGNGRMACVLLDQIIHLYGYCLEMPCHGQNAGAELRLARRLALSGDIELLRFKIEHGLKTVE